MHIHNGYIYLNRFFFTIYFFFYQSPKTEELYIIITALGKERQVIAVFGISANGNRGLAPEMQCYYNGNHGLVPEMQWYTNGKHGLARFPIKVITSADHLR
jgi:hypothetical protein